MAIVKATRRESMIAPLAALSVAASLLTVTVPAFDRMGAASELITDHVVEIHETVSEAGFVHPGVGLSAEDLRTAQEMARSDQEPWASYFAAVADTDYAAPDYRASNSKSEDEPDVAADPDFSHVGLRYREVEDSFGAMTQALMWTVTGDEIYRRNAIQALRTWASMNPDGYEYFADAHIHTGKPLYQFLLAAEIIRATDPVEDDTPGEYEGYDVVWSAADDQNLLSNFADPIVETFLYSNTRWMNQHNYGLFGRIGTAIYADDAEAYATGVEWYTVNASYDGYDNGAIAPQMPLIEADDPANPYEYDFVQVREMGRDQAHSEGDIENFAALARLLETQGTKVDPVHGTVSTADTAVSAYDFLDRRLLHGADAFWGFMLGASTPWIDEQGTGVTISQAYRGRLFNATNELYYEYAYERDVDVESEAPYVAALAERMSGPYYWYGTNTVNFWAPGDKNPESWVAFPEELAGTEPTPLPQTHALTFADAGLTLDEGTRMVTEDGADFARASLSAEGTTSAVSRMMHEADAHIGLRFRSNGPAELEVLYKEEPTGLNPDEAPTRVLADIELPDTGNEWRFITYPAGGSNVHFYRLTGDDGTTVDLDEVILSAATDLSAPELDSVEDAYYLTARQSSTIDLSATDAEEAVTYSADRLPNGAVLDAATGLLTWKPAPRDKGRYELQLVADDGESVAARTVELVVSPNRQSTIEAAVEDGIDPDIVHTTATWTLFETALGAAEDAARHGTETAFDEAFAALLEAIDALVPLNPQLGDGTLAYADIASADGLTATAVDALADGDSTTHTGDLRTASFTLDFGTRYRVSAEAFGFQARSLFGNRSEGTNVYGSDDGRTWDLLTERTTADTLGMETIDVVAEHAGEAYRFLKVQVDEPGEPNDPAYPGIWSIGEFRVHGERSEVSGDITEVSVASPDSLADRVTVGDEVEVSFTSATEIDDVAVAIDGQDLEVESEDSLQWTATGTLGELSSNGRLDLTIDHTTVDGATAATVHASTDGTALYGSDERNLVNLATAEVVAADGQPDADKASHAAALLDGDVATFSDVAAVDGEFFLIWDFGDGARLELDRADFLARQDDNGLVHMADLVLEGSNDLETWTQLTDPTFKTLSWQRLDAHTDAGFRYVRIVNGALINVAEMRLFGELDLDLATILARAEAVDTDAHSRASAILFTRELEAVAAAAGEEGADETALAQRMLMAWDLLEAPATEQATEVEASWVTASSESWDGSKDAAANGWAMFDGDTSTFTDTTAAAGWVRIAPEDAMFVVDKVRFHPRSSHASRAVGIRFQGSNDDGESWTTFATSDSVSAGWNMITLAEAGEYDELRVSAESGNVNLAEVEFLMTVPDRTGLRLLLDEGADLTETDWTAGSWAELIAARDGAQAVADDDSATQEEVDTAADALADAVASLVAC